MHLLQITHCLDKKNLKKMQIHELSEANKTGLGYCEGIEGERRLYELEKRLMLYAIAQFFVAPSSVQ